MYDNKDEEDDDASKQSILKDGRIAHPSEGYSEDLRAMRCDAIAFESKM